MVSCWLTVCQTICLCVHLSIFQFSDNNWSKWIFTKLGVCTDIVEIWFGIVNRQILSISDSYLPETDPYFHFRMITLVNINGFSPKLDVCIDIMEICFGIADRQIWSIFDRVICPGHVRIFISG